MALNADTTAPGTAAPLLWATEHEARQALVLLLRPGFMVLLFMAGWAAGISFLTWCRVDHARVLGLSDNEVCVPRNLLFTVVALALPLVSLHGLTLQDGGGISLGVLWAPLVGYALLLLALWCPLPKPLERRAGVCRRPFRHALWRCVWPSEDRETPFIEVMVGDGLTSIAKCLFDLGVGFCAVQRAGGAPVSNNAVWFADVPVGPQVWQVAPTQVPTEGSVLGTALDECARSPWPFVLWALPSLIRARQCIISSRFARNEEQRSQHYANLAKYMTALPIVLLAFCHAEASGGSVWVGLGASDFHALWAFAGLVNCVFAGMWDLVFDWGLMQAQPWRSSTILYSGLRPVLLLWPRIPLYHCAIAANLFGRTIWTARWSPQCVFIGGVRCSGVQQFCEVVRRCLWNVLRIEWQVIKNGLHSDGCPPAGPM